MTLSLAVSGVAQSGRLLSRSTDVLVTEDDPEVGRVDRAEDRLHHRHAVSSVRAA